MASDHLAILLTEQARKLAEYEAAQEADLVAKLALWSAEREHDEAEMQARVHWRATIAAAEPKLTVDAMKDRLAVAVWDDPFVTKSAAQWEAARTDAARAGVQLSIARRRLDAVARAIEALAAG